MAKDSIAFFFFKSSLEFEKKTYQLSITVFYNNKMQRKEYEVLSNEFNGSNKLLIHQSIDSTEREWFDVNASDNSPLIQEIGYVIYKHNI